MRAGGDLYTCMVIVVNENVCAVVHTDPLQNKKC